MSGSKSLVIAALAVCVVLQLAACSRAPSESPVESPSSKAATEKPLPKATGVIVTIKDSKVDFPAVQVKVGTTVTWVNADDVDHTVVFADGPSSGRIPPGTRANHQFTATGSFKYQDPDFPDVKGEIVVTK